MEPIPSRLAKVVREAMGWSVQQVERSWREGRIELGREAPFALAELVYPDDLVRVDRSPLPATAPRRCFVLHKPPQVTSTTRDPDGLADLGPWLRTLPQGVFPVGRLDRDTTGLLLLTNDGDLAFALLCPNHDVEKEYRARLRWSVARDDARLSQLRAGVRLGAELACVRRAELEGDPSQSLVVILTEGKHRQVRRMCKAVGLALSALARVRIGPVHLGTLAVGATRELSESEVRALWEAVGGRRAVRARQRLALVGLADRRRRDGTPDAKLEAWLAASTSVGSARETNR